MVSFCPQGQPDGELPIPQSALFPLGLPCARYGVQDLRKERVGSLPESPFPRERSLDPALIWPGYAKNNTDAKASEPQTWGRRPPQAQLLRSGLYYVTSVNMVGVAMALRRVEEEAVEWSQTPGFTCSHTRTCTQAATQTSPGRPAVVPGFLWP